MPIVMNASTPRVSPAITDHLFSQAEATKLCTCGKPRGYHVLRAEPAKAEAVAAPAAAPPVARPPEKAPEVAKEPEAATAVPGADKPAPG